jgi:hypothetical protein
LRVSNFEKTGSRPPIFSSQKIYVTRECRILA